METINGQLLKGMLESGANNLNNQKKDVDAKNVFPVPDGDTGTNMSLTFTNGIVEVKKSGSDVLSVVAKTFSRGLLMGARGNSGVILSQIFRGFAKAVKDKDEVTVAEFSEAMFNGAQMAYKAVMRPVEGTILTVIREASEMADFYTKDHPEATLSDYIDILCKEAKDSLDRTPDLLPVLKEANVVDSGGAGLVVIFEGFRAFVEGAPVEEMGEAEKIAHEKNEKASGYATEFILQLSEESKHFFRKEEFYSALEKIGNHITLLREEDTVKLHVDTMTPGSVLTMAEKYGEFTKIQIESFKGEMSPSIIAEEKPQEEKEYGIITIAVGDGLKKLFTEYRADVVVSGGQTMNPSTEDICSAINQVNARHIYVLPNNSNIIMAANQAAAVTKGKDIIVLETKSVPQGLSACISFNPEAGVEENTEVMKEAIANVKTGQITYAIKDTTMNDLAIHAGDYMGLFDKEIKLTDKDKVKAACALIDAMCDEDSEIVTLIRGEDATEAECQEVAEYISSHYDVDVDVEDGGQPVYCFVIGVE